MQRLSVQVHADDTRDSSSSGTPSSSMSSPDASVCCDFLSIEAGPETPVSRWASKKQLTDGFTLSHLQPQQHRTVFSTLQVSVPSSPAAGVSIPTASAARRVLNSDKHYSDVCSWLDQQISMRKGPTGQLLSGRSHATLVLGPELEAPTTPAQPAEGTNLPPPAFQLLGLL